MIYFRQMSRNYFIENLQKYILETDFLRDRDKAVLLGRLDRRTLESIGKQYGVTQDRIRQIERRSTDRLMLRIRHYAHWSEIELKKIK